MLVPARHRRLIHILVALLWVVPGAPLSWLLRNSVPWIVFMSWFACVYTSLAAWAAETPVETEGS